MDVRVDGRDVGDRPRSAGHPHATALSRRLRSHGHDRNGDRLRSGVRGHGVQRGHHLPSGQFTRCALEPVLDQPRRQHRLVRRDDRRVASRGALLSRAAARLADLKGYIGFGLYQMGERSIYYWAANIDYLLIGRYLGPEQLGVYTIAYNLVVMPLTKLTPVLTRVAFPIFAKRQDADAALRRGYLELIELVAFATFPLLVGLAASASVAVVALFGAAWVPSVLLVQLLTPMGMMKTISSPSGSLLLAKGRADIGFWFNVINTAVTVGVLYVAVRFGTAAVAAAHSVLGVAALPLELYFLWRVTRLQAGAYLRRLCKPLLTSAIMGTCVYLTCLAVRHVLPER